MEAESIAFAFTSIVKSGTVAVGLDVKETSSYYEFVDQTSHFRRQSEERRRCIGHNPSWYDQLSIMKPGRMENLRFLSDLMELRNLLNSRSRSSTTAELHINTAS